MATVAPTFYEVIDRESLKWYGIGTKLTITMWCGLNRVDIDSLLIVEHVEVIDVFEEGSDPSGEAEN